jgi:putative transposase
LNYLLKAARMAKSTYYFELKNENNIDGQSKKIEDKIRQIFEEHKGRYGVRRVYHELRNGGYKVNHKRVQRIMHQDGLLGKRPKAKYHSYKGTISQLVDNVINRDFTASAPLTKWTTDVSQFIFSWGKCYFSPILDMATNEIISYDLSMRPDIEQIKRMLDGAFNKFPDVSGLIFHSDQGWQYQHAYYKKRLKMHGIIQSMSRKGNCYDNSVMETFFGRMKTEMYYGSEKEYKSYDEFSKAVENYIYYYNNERIQRKTKWMPPVKYREASISRATL